MGKVYAPEIVGRAELPVPGAHQEAGRFILNRLAESPMQAGAIFGSTAFGRSDIRSDVDGIFLHDPEADPEIAESVFKQVVSQARQNYKVHVEAKLYDASEVPILMGKKICPMFAEHIDEVCRLDNPSWSFNDPAKDMRPAFLAADDIESRIRSSYGNFWHKTEMFDRALADYGGLTVNYGILQRAVELPNAVARKLLPITQEPGETLPHITDKTGNVSRVAQKILAYCTGNGPQVVNDYQHLRAINNEYSRVLQDTAEGKTTIAEYSYWLDENYAPAISLAASISFAALDITRARYEQTTGFSSVVLDADPSFEDHYEKGYVL